MTHVTYPVLVWVRSARATRHYVISLLAIMDAAALKLALTTKLPRKEAFALLLEGGQTFEVLYVFMFQKRSWSTRMPFSGRFTGQSPRGRLATSRLPPVERPDDRHPRGLGHGRRAEPRRRRRPGARAR